MLYSGVYLNPATLVRAFLSHGTLSSKWLDPDSRPVVCTRYGRTAIHLSSQICDIRRGEEIIERGWFPIEWMDGSE